MNEELPRYCVPCDQWVPPTPTCSVCGASTVYAQPATRSMTTATLPHERDALLKIQAKYLERVRAEGGRMTDVRRERSIEQLRDVLSILCNFVWTRQLRPGEHLWSIPADPERDFDCILSDAIDELEELRKKGHGA